MEMQADPPVPTDPSVYIETRAERAVVSKQFKGFPSDAAWVEKAAELYEAATGAGLTVSTAPWWSAVYDGPNVIFNRRNEVWLEV